MKLGYNRYDRQRKLSRMIEEEEEGEEGAGRAREDKKEFHTVRYNPRIRLVGWKKTNFTQLNISEGTGPEYHKITYGKVINTAT
jgi:hypothetical protein